MYDDEDAEIEAAGLRPMRDYIRGVLSERFELVVNETTRTLYIKRKLAAPLTASKKAAVEAAARIELPTRLKGFKVNPS
ncbi:MAG TPA: hypothetical protein VGJ84_07380 [Polyangiaceae bacterium]|jgi:hypothetical protein